MDRRETLKTLLLASVGSNIIFSARCSTPNNPNNIAARTSWTELPSEYYYGRTDVEKAHDEHLLNQTYFSNHELVTIAVLCDIILPKENPNGGALDAGVPDFVEFISKERENFKIPLRGGIMWLDNYAIRHNGADFISLSESSRLMICDLIAYPEEKATELQPGIQFFSLIRDLTMTGYYTTELGFRDLGYQGNSPNIWDGVPEEILQRHGKKYDPEWLTKCVDQSQREILAEWDDDMNLIN
jgi:hypothetical protein